MTAKMKKLYLFVFATLVSVVLLAFGAAFISYGKNNAQAASGGFTVKTMALVTNTYDTIDEALDKADNFSTVIMNEDAVLTESKTISKKITLDLNGHTLTGPSEGYAVTVNTSGMDLTPDLTVVDNSAEKTGAITGNGGVCLISGTFNLNGGSISGCSAQNGAGVQVSGGTFNFNGGAITNNVAQSTGGGVRVTGGAFNMSGGKISGNKAGNGGGVWSSRDMSMT